MDHDGRPPRGPVSNRVKIILLSAALGLGVVAVFRLVHGVTDGAWVVSVPAAAVAALAARSIYWWSLSRQTNDSHVVATEHGPAGNIEAIEVFWRPG